MAASLMRVAAIVVLMSLALLARTPGALGGRARALGRVKAAAKACTDDAALARRFAEFRLRVDRGHEAVSCEHVKTFAQNIRLVEDLRVRQQHRDNDADDDNGDVLNDEDEAEYSADHSPFGDMTPQEFREKVLMTEVDAAALGFEAASDEGAALRESAATPDFDWALKGAVSEVRSQGSVGTCYAFAAAGAVEGQLAIHHGIRNALVSVEHVIECDDGHEVTPARTIADCGEFGGWPHLVFSFWKGQGGFVAEADFPYCAGVVDPKTLMPKCFPCMVPGYSVEGCGDHGDLYCNASSTEGQSARGAVCKDASWIRRHRLGVPASWTKLSTDVSTQTEQIAKLGPVTALMDATALQFYRRGVADPWLCSKTVKNHAVLITGHGPGWFRVKNSWGPKFGENGFFRIRENKCGINDIVYGVALAQTASTV